jgi:hypothetical protein
MKGLCPTVALLAALMLGLPSDSSARIGETLQQCIARYGQPEDNPQESAVHPKATDCAFIKSGLDISVVFYQGKAVDIMFRKLDGSAFNPSEVEELLKANGGSSSWNQHEAKRPDQSEWKTTDGARRATLNPNRRAETNRVLSIWTEQWHRVMDEHEKALEQREKSAAKENLEGF